MANLTLIYGLRLLPEGEVATIEDANRHCKQIRIPATEVAARSDMACIVDGPVLRDECYALFTHPRMLRAFKLWSTRKRK